MACSRTSVAPDARAVASSCWEVPRIHQREIIEPHVLHGTRYRPDVSRVRGSDKYDSNRHD